MVLNVNFIFYIGIDGESIEGVSTRISKLRP
jgi:hypothetical protein